MSQRIDFRQTDEFLERLAEQLRRPLEPIREAAEELRMTAAESKALRLGEIMLRQVQDVSDIADALIDVSRLNRGLVALDAAETSLYAALEAAIEECRVDLEAKNQRLVVNMPQEDLPAVRGELARIVQVLKVLLSNAVKFTPAGGSIYLSFDQAGSDAVIEIRDDGCGIEPEQLPLLFEPPYEVGPHTQSSSGLGLGLPIANHLVNLHGGSISASSEGAGQGALFRVALPLFSPQA